MISTEICQTDRVAHKFISDKCGATIKSGLRKVMIPNKSFLTKG